MTQTVDPQITKKRVTMRTASVVPGMKGPKGEPVTAVSEMVTYVREDFLDAYVADARTRWQTVEVSEEYDAGPGGYDGATYVPAGHRPLLPDGTRGEFVPFPHPLAGTYYPATDCGRKCKHAPEGAHVVHATPES